LAKKQAILKYKAFVINSMGKIALVNATSFTTLYAFWLNMEQNFEKKSNSGSTM
jgi:hypothetical protein